jgi:osmotically-inducible protein OsmY
MFAYTKTLLSLSLLLIGMAAGCNQQDAECLSRIGKKMAAHAKSGAGEVGGKVDFRWAHFEPSLHDKIVDRLRYENTLTELKFEVVVKNKEVELKGAVKTPLQRQRAIELAETTAGVDKVVDSLKVQEQEAP